MSSATRISASGCSICVDFAHLYARGQGQVDYGKIIKKLPKKFFEPLAEALLKARRDITLICESPLPYKDAAMMKRVVSALMAAKKPSGSNARKD